MLLLWLWLSVHSLLGVISRAHRLIVVAFFFFILFVLCLRKIFPPMNGGATDRQVSLNIIVDLLSSPNTISAFSRFVVIFDDYPPPAHTPCRPPSPLRRTRVRTSTNDLYRGSLLSPSTSSQASKVHLSPLYTHQCYQTSYFAKVVRCCCSQHCIVVVLLPS